MSAEHDSPIVATPDHYPENSIRAQAYSVKTACQRLGGISRSTLYRKIECGELAAKKLGGRTVIMAAEVDRYLALLPALGAPRAKL
ncbi:excisionase family DNA-binding protein [Shinella sp. CPCC 101442]|uniref:helix-turn-helix transcriptional regulator n=1 Tax=Shinella sp. CPCC 101442 TaxID=2932265 RepID=UPI0021532207|nr:excisionase family DNA-binding protein [Shinella sp. CPCC 101442]MCR6501537.1 excisionase family DNA-binding protein [Shinella sp. CPCC 101442]